MGVYRGRVGGGGEGRYGKPNSAMYRYAGAIGLTVAELSQSSFALVIGFVCCVWVQDNIGGGATNEITATSTSFSPTLVSCDVCGKTMGKLPFDCATTNDDDDDVDDVDDD